mgnify:CR=1 FL=1
MKNKLKVLFLCTGNSCRSQMAEGWIRHLHGDVVEAWSAGIETHGLNPNAVAVMKEAGVDISGHRSKNVAELLDVPFDFVITVCGDADERCPFFPETPGSSTGDSTTLRSSPWGRKRRRKKWTATGGSGTKYARF